MKKILSLVLVFILLLGAFSVCADDVKDDGRVKSMVSLGDYLSLGYSADSEDTETENTESEEKKTPSFADEAAKKLGLVNGETYFNYSSDSTSSADLLTYLSGELGDSEKAAFAGADTVTLTVGMIDLTSAIMPKIAIALGLSEGASYVEITDALSKIGEENLKNALEEVKKIYEKNKDSLEALVKNYGESVADSYKKIRELSPNAQVFFVNLYDPFADMPQYALVKTLRTDLSAKLVSDMNKKLEETAKSEGFHIVDARSELNGRKSACIELFNDRFYLTENGRTILADALVYKINAVYDEMSDIEKGNSPDPKDVWMWFALSVAIVFVAVPTVSFVAKKSKGK